MDSGAYCSINNTGDAHSEHFFDMDNRLEQLTENGAMPRPVGHGNETKNIPVLTIILKRMFSMDRFCIGTLQNASAESNM